MSSFQDQVTQAAQGLLFISESDAPLEPFSLPPATAAGTEAGFLAAMGLTGQPVEQVELPYFFRNMVRPSEDPAEQATAERFKALQTWLETNLQELKVYRVGQTQVQAYIIGKVPDDTWLGLKTTLIET